MPVYKLLHRENHALHSQISRLAGISGFVEIDDSLFDGTSSQFVSNSFFTDLSLDVFGELFSLVDVVTTDDTIFDSTGTIPVIVNGAGNLADNGMTAISFFHDSFDGTAFGGDASLATGASGSLADSDFYAVKWEVATKVPEPSAFLLLSAGLLLLVKRKVKIERVLCDLLKNQLLAGFLYPKHA